MKVVSKRVAENEKEGGGHVSKLYYYIWTYVLRKKV